MPALGVSGVLLSGPDTVLGCWMLPVRRAEGAVTGASGAVGDPEPSRPDLAVPLPQVPEPTAALRFLLTGLRAPTFRRARRNTLLWAVAAVVPALLAVPAGPRLRTVALTAAAALACYVLVRAYLLVRLERRQAEFEPGWLAQRSEALRRRSFEVVRCSLQLDRAPRPVDLTSPREVSRLLRLREGDGACPMLSVEFLYEPEPGGHPAVEQVRRPLSDIGFVPVLDPWRPARVSFPAARYLPRPPVEDEAPRTSWLLTGPVQVTVARPS